ncbi:pyridoxamine 5'-phosphate oxidase family protein [Nocardia sp. BMG51109]|uniref:pyridoxamine 5'-phosphate oxidase family protein n=1 Tax=Nocardia sp. BMG51109 TaxID=1056816 RepID=UPI000463852A|nr:pyridoxamine 5'-phosphate oxidase family protein [Nocardia sp. BMG51109]
MTSRLSVSHLLPPDEALRRLATVRFGRLVYSRRALLAVHPVDHLVDDGVIVVHTDPATLTLTGHRQVVAYEADSIDNDTRVGWHVTVEGVVEEVGEPDRLRWYQEVWHPAAVAGRLLRIHPEIVTGAEYRGPATIMTG